MLLINKHQKYIFLNKSNNLGFSNPTSINGFTIVELLVVIVVIGILAAITMVSYSGISGKATVAVMKSDLSSSSNQLKIYQAFYGSYPTALDNDCPSAPAIDSTLCLKASSNNTYTYISDGTTFSLTETNSNGTAYTVTDSQSPQLKATLAVSDPANWLAIGTQVWAKANLNVGTKIVGSLAQTSGNGIEKYCYDDNEDNCTTYGGLYQWDEAMQYANNPNTNNQGICPAGSHIPSDNDWKVLEIQLGMTTDQADATGNRGTDQGTQLQLGGLSGLDIPISGFREEYGYSSYLYKTVFTGLWSSSESSTNAWYHYLYAGNATVGRGADPKVFGYSIRCMGN